MDRSSSSLCGNANARLVGSGLHRPWWMKAITLSTQRLMANTIIQYGSPLLCWLWGEWVGERTGVRRERRRERSTTVVEKQTVGKKERLREEMWKTCGQSGVIRISAQVRGEMTTWGHGDTRRGHDAVSATCWWMWQRADGWEAKLESAQHKATQQPLNMWPEKERQRPD